MDFKEAVAKRMEDLIIADDELYENLSEDDLFRYFTDAEVLVAEDLQIKADNMRKEMILNGNRN